MLGPKLMQIFKETTSDESYPGSWERRRSQFEHCNGLVRSENEARILYTVEKGSLKVHILPPRYAWRNYILSSICAAQHGLYTSNLPPTSTPMQLRGRKSALPLFQGERLYRSVGSAFELFFDLNCARPPTG